MRIALRSSNLAHRRPLWPILGIALLFLVAAIPLILSGSMVGRYAWDQVNYHEKVVRTFVAQWPSPDVSNYLSATTPLYHLVLAAWGKHVSASDVSLQLASSAFTLGFLVTFALALAKTTTAMRVFVSSLALAASLYVFPGGVWLLPDNAAWWGVLGILLLAWSCRFSLSLVAGGGVLLTLLVCLRQSHVWAAAPLWAAAWMSLHPAPMREGDPADVSQSGVFSEPARRLTRAFVTLLATLPAFAVVAYFAKIWGGRLYPPAFDSQLKYPPNPAMPVFIMAVIGAVNVFFAAHLLPRLMVLWRRARPLLVGVLLVSIILASIPHTSRSIDDGRYSGLWGLAANTPVMLGRSPAMIALAAWGALAVLGWLIALPIGPRVVVVVTLVSFIAALSTGHWAYQRYCEPMALMLTLLLAARTPEWPTPRWLSPLKVLGPFALVLVVVAVTSVNLARAKPALDEGFGLRNVPPIAAEAPPKGK